jgi:hypothetical protein
MGNPLCLLSDRPLILFAVGWNGTMRGHFLWMIQTLLPQPSADRRGLFATLLLLLREQDLSKARSNQRADSTHL